MGSSLRSCVEVRESIELSFGVVSGVEPGIDVLGGGPRASRESGRFWGCFLHWPNGFKGLFVKRNVFDACVKS